MADTPEELLRLCNTVETNAGILTHGQMRKLARALKSHLQPAPSDDALPAIDAAMAELSRKLRAKPTVTRERIADKLKELWLDGDGTGCGDVARLRNADAILALITNEESAT